MGSNNNQFLYQACRDGQLEKVKEIIADESIQVDVNARSEERRFTVLHVATWERHGNILCFLLENGFKSIINESDRDEDTALHLAATIGDENMCRTLVNAGANVLISNKKGNTAFHQACKHPSSIICNMFLESARECLDLENKVADTPLLLAATHDSVEVCSMLLQEGANHLVKDGNDDTVLHIAASRSSLDLCVALVAKDKEWLSETNKKGETALHKAAERNHPEICRLLLDNGCNFEIQNEQRHTALHIAANKTDIDHPDNATEICKMLLDKGADWSLKNNNEDTVLHVAARKVNVKICNMLVEKGADCLVENKAGHTPWDVVPPTRQYKLENLKAETEKARFSKLEEESGTTPVKNVKLFLCGDPAVGKTTLRRSLIKGRLAKWLPRPGWRLRPHIPTPGVNVKPKHVRGAGSFVIWDMAGQIEYHVTHAMLLGSSSGVFVVVFDMTWSEIKQKERLMYWLAFIKAGQDPKKELKPPIVVVGTHIDHIEEDNFEKARKAAHRLLRGIINLFGEFLDIHKDVILIDGRCSRSGGITTLKAILKDLAEPLRQVLTPNICADIAKRMSSWSKSKLPIMYFSEFLKKVNSEVNKKANESLVRVVVGYLHQTGELHCAKVRQSGDEHTNGDLIILNPNWLTTTIFGPIFAKPGFRRDYQGLEEKQVYNLDDLKDHFHKVPNYKLLVDLLEYFELAYRRNDTSFIVPVKLPPDVANIDWSGDESYPIHYGLRIACRDETDMFTVDTFPCLQVRALNKYNQQDVDPKLSHLGLKVCKSVEGFVQLTKDKRAIHIAVRMNEGEEVKGREQLNDMREMVSFELFERSIGTRVNTSYLSSIDMCTQRDLEEKVYYYSQEEVEAAIRENEQLINKRGLQRESVESVTGLQDKEMLQTIESLSPSTFRTREDISSDYSLSVDNKAFRDLAAEIGHEDWKAFGNYLGIKNAEIYAITCNHPDNVKEQTYQMLVQWRQKEGKDVDTEALRKALEKIKRLDLAYGISESAKILNDDTLESIVNMLDTRQWQTLAIKLGCSPEMVYEKEPTAYVFVKWRRRQPKNIDVVKYMAAGLQSIGRKHLADKLVENVDSDTPAHKE